MWRRRRSRCDTRRGRVSRGRGRRRSLSLRGIRARRQSRKQESRLGVCFSANAESVGNDEGGSSITGTTAKSGVPVRFVSSRRAVSSRRLNAAKSR
jgi:hypothetical protein